MKYIDELLNSITMYRVVLYGLFFVSAMAIVFAFMNVLSFDGFQLMASLIYLIIICFVFNIIFSKILKAYVNVESWAITALILFLIIPPASNFSGYLILTVAAVAAIASKYLLAIYKKHLFNPAAIGAFILGLTGIGGASWWAGSLYLLVPVSVVGFMIVRKIRRFSMFIAFLVGAVLVILYTRISSSMTTFDLFKEILVSWPLIFFGTVMLTEPLTTPPTRKLQILYGLIVGIIFGSKFNLGPIYPTPEVALLAGNIFSYIVSPKQKLFLKLKEKVQVAKDTYEFIFTRHKNFDFKPGQYLEWTVEQNKTDTRGNRRYFTIASSPTEDEIKLGVRLSTQSSTFKQKLMDLEINDTVIGSQLSGEFTLPKNSKERMVFIAGGIGVTPFRSMVKYMIDKEDKRDVVMFYANKFEEDIAYKSLFDEAETKLNFRTIYILTEKLHAPKEWKGETGFLDEKMIEKYISDYKERKFLLSGPQGMVNAYKDLLLRIGVKRTSILTDYFPGF